MNTEGLEQLIGDIKRQNQYNDDVVALCDALKRAVRSINEMAGDHWLRSDISPGIELREIESILRR